ncbi:MAG TPA: hypothetical protein V6C63_16170 [Allocoleopsis sp.]
MIPTIKVQGDTPNGYILINEDDFDPNQHQRYEESQSKSSTTTETNETEGSTSEQNSPPPSRQAELEALYDAEGYRAIQAIAEPLGIEKPKAGWRDAIPLIVEQEQGASQQL